MNNYRLVLEPSPDHTMICPCASSNRLSRKSERKFKFQVEQILCIRLKYRTGYCKHSGVDFAPRPAEVHPLVLQICTSSPFTLLTIKIDLWICLGSFFVAYLIALVLTRLRSWASGRACLPTYLPTYYTIPYRIVS